MKAELLTVSEADKALFLPPPGLEMRALDSSGNSAEKPSFLRPRYRKDDF